MHVRTQLLLQLMNLESRKERKEKKGTPIDERVLHFIVIASLSYFSNRSRPSGDQTSTFSGPGHFLITMGDRVSAKF